MTWPRKLSDWQRRGPFDGWNKIPAPARAAVTAARAVLCEVCTKDEDVVHEHDNMGRWPKMSSRWHWKTLGALAMPNGRQLKWNRPNNMMNMVNSTLA